MNDHERIQTMLTAYESGLLTSEQRKDVEAHLMGCDSCFEDLYEFAPAAQEIRRQRMQSPVVRRPRREKVRFLIAAVMVIAAAAGYWIYRNTAVIEEPVLRGTDAITLQSPAEGQELTPPVVFRWSDRSDADEYVLSIYNKEGRIIHQDRVKIIEYLWKPDTPQSAIYRWNIEAYLSDGTRTASSKVFEFRLK